LKLVRGEWPETEKTQQRATAQGQSGVMLFSSGTSGPPKGIELTYAALEASARASAANLGWQPDDRWLLSISLGHIGGLSIATRVWLARSTVVMGGAGPFDPHEVHGRIVRARVRLLSWVPTQLFRIVRAGLRAPTCVRAVLVGGAPLSPTLAQRALELGWPVLATYGMTETASQVATTPLGELPHGAGRPLPGVELVIAEDGQLGVQGAILATRVWQRGHRDGPAVAHEVGPTWWSQDIGSFDAQGYVHVRGRRDGMVLSGGKHVFPEEIEQALSSVPGVLEVAVVSVPDAEWGEKLVGHIVGEITARALRAAVEHLLPAYAIPRDLRVWSELPRLPSGKLDRARLKTM
jgi:O-succinylbenzoic acid--CoA ligase